MNDLNNHQLWSHSLWHHSILPIPTDYYMMLGRQTRSMFNPRDIASRGAPNMAAEGTVLETKH